MRNEADTQATPIKPKLKAAGWTDTHEDRWGKRPFYVREAAIREAIERLMPGHKGFSSGWPRGRAGRSSRSQGRNARSRRSSRSGTGFSQTAIEEIEMLLVFVDECGYAKNWKAESRIKEQPVHVAAAVCIGADHIEQAYKDIRDTVRGCQIPHVKADALGKGEEIKAAPLDRNDGFWQANPKIRDKVRQAYLDVANATYVIVCIDKDRHKTQYGDKAEDPAEWSLRLLFERIQGVASERKEHVIVFIDLNKREEAAQRSWLSRLLRIGSYGLSRLYGPVYEWDLRMENILEFHFADSKYSLGLQVADFVARHSYSYWKSGRKRDYPGWSVIEQKLFRYPNYKGWGYKEFP